MDHEAKMNKLLNDGLDTSLVDTLEAPSKDYSALDVFYLGIAFIQALQSPDTSTQNGAVLVSADDRKILGYGCNRLPDGVEVNDARLERPAKYRFTEHAERNAIYHAAQQGNATLGTTLYVPWYACADCGRAIIQAGIKRVVGHDCYRQWYESDGEELNDPNRMSWDDSIADAVTMMQEAGVEMVHVTDNLNMGIKIRYNGVERDI
jgi:dCMP deaminase